MVSRLTPTAFARSSRVMFFQTRCSRMVVLSSNAASLLFGDFMGDQCDDEDDHAYGEGERECGSEE